MRALLCIAMLGQFGACALVSRGETLHVRYYSLEDRGAARAVTDKSELSLRLGRVDASSGLGEQIAVRTGDHEISYLEDQRWTERPVQFARRALERALFSERGLTRSYSSQAKRLELELTALELVDTKQGARARVRLTTQVRDEHHNLCNHDIESALPISTDPRAHMEQSVAALANALHQAVEQVASHAVACLSAPDNSRGP